MYHFTIRNPITLTMKKSASHLFIFRGMKLIISNLLFWYGNVLSVIPNIWNRNKYEKPSPSLPFRSFLFRSFLFSFLFFSFLLFTSLRQAGTSIVELILIIFWISNLRHRHASIRFLWRTQNLNLQCPHVSYEDYSYNLPQPGHSHAAFLTLQ